MPVLAHSYLMLPDCQAGEYDRQMLQSQTTEQATAPRGVGTKTLAVT